MFGHTQHETLMGFPRRDVKETVGSLSLENKEEIWHGDNKFRILHLIDGI